MNYFQDNETNGNPPRFSIKVKSVRPEIRWKFKSCNQDCYICLKPLHYTCNNCIDPSVCKSVILKCCHGYHYHCIEQFSRTCEYCPLDQIKIEYADIDPIDNIENR